MASDPPKVLYAFLTGQAGARPGGLGQLMTLARKQVEPLRFDVSVAPARRAIHNLPRRCGPGTTGGYLGGMECGH